MTKLTGYETKNLIQRKIVISFKYKGGSKKKIIKQSLAVKSCNFELEYRHDIFSFSFYLL